MISVYVVDARELLRRGLREAINETPGMSVAGEAESAAAALRELGQVDPDVIVIDFDDGDAAVLQLCKLVSAAPDPTPVLVSLRSANRNRISEAVLAGASDHVLLTDPAARVVERIRAIHDAPPPLGSETVGDLFDRVRTGQSTQRSPLTELTAREREIMELLSDGLDNRRIGDALHLSPKTVKNYVSAILKKLGMTSRTEAAVFAAREAARAESS